MTDTAREGSWRSWAWAHGRTDVVALLDLADAVRRFVETPSPVAAARLHVGLAAAVGPPPAWAPDATRLRDATAPAADAAPDERARLEVAVRAARTWLASYEQRVAAETARRAPSPGSAPGDGG